MRTKRAYVLLGLLTFASSALADDLSVDSISFSTLPGGQVQAEIALTLDSNATFDYEFKVEQIRSGSVIATPMYSSGTSSLGSACAVGCSFSCSGDCSRYLLGFLNSGSCVLKLGSPCSSNYGLCNCKVKKDVSVVFQSNPLSNDQIRATLTPGAGISDANSANNSLTVTY